jgi:hypothetical protein
MKHALPYRGLVFALFLRLFGPSVMHAAEEPTPMQAALAFREALAGAVIGGTTKPADAIAQLKAYPDASGLGINPDADFAYAAIDIGQRLISAGKPAEAGPLFAVAETALDALIQRTPDANAREKAEYLCRVALVRWKYLRNVRQAKRDLDRAILLPGADSYRKQARENLLRSNAAFAQEGQTGGTP